MFYSLTNKCEISDIYVDENGEEQLLSDLTDSELKELGISKLVVEGEFKNVAPYQNAKISYTTNEETNVTTKAISYVDNDLDIVKAYQIDLVTKAMNKALDEGVTYNNATFKSTAEDKALLTSIITIYNATQALPNGFTGLVSEDASTNLTTIDALIGLAQVLALHEAQCRYNKISIELQIKAATDVATVQNLTYGG